MINVDTTEKRLNRKKVKMRNHYTDLIAFTLIIAYVLGCYFLFNSFNPFTSTWGLFRIVSQEEKQVVLDSKTTMIQPSFRDGYMTTLIKDLEKSNFKIIDRQTHLLIVEKDGLSYTYKFLEKSLFGGNYTLVTKEETEK